MSQGPGDQAAIDLQELAIVAVVTCEVIGMADRGHLPAEILERLLLFQGPEALLAALQARRAICCADSATSGSRGPWINTDTIDP
jgi:hypothetical protein